jgi:hypothetical protein
LISAIGLAVPHEERRYAKSRPVTCPSAFISPRTYDGIPVAFTEIFKTEVPVPSEKVPERRRFAVDPAGNTVGMGSG